MTSPVADDKPPRVGGREGVVNPTLAEGQEVTALAMARVKGGFVALKLTVEGWAVTDAEILTEGVVPKHHAEDALRFAVATEFLGFSADDVPAV